MTDRLPRESDERVIEVRLGHVFLTLGIIIIVGAGSATLITIVKGHQQQQRQQALLDSIREITIIAKKPHPNCLEEAFSGPAFGGG